MLSRRRVEHEIPQPQCAIQREPWPDRRDPSQSNKIWSGEEGKGAEAGHESLTSGEKEA